VATYQIGELDQRIEIFRQVKSDDGQGGFITSDVLQHTLWAHVITKGGGEVFKFEKVEATAVFTFVIRFNSQLGIQEDDFIRWEGVDYNIRAILKKSGRRLYLEIDAERGVAQ